MTAKLTSHCTHGDKEYEKGDVVKNAKIAQALIAAGVAIDVKEEKEEK